MTGEGCVYTDHIDKTLRDRERDVEGQIKGFMIMPYRPRLGVFLENCLKPFPL